jgi:Raf kinase inhibitor-like YbhB/YbcL family protein
MLQKTRRLSRGGCGAAPDGNPAMRCDVAMLAGLLLFSTAAAISTNAHAGEDAVMPLTLQSPAFEPNGNIPRVHTCEGSDVSPPLQWQEEPANTKSFALVIDDPDAPDPNAPKMTWVHWVVYNLPASTHALSQGASRKMPAGAREGVNDWKRPGYGGPCPPVGRHRYFHKLYALDVELPDLHEPTKAQLEAAMKGHVVAQAEIVGTYQKGGA